MKLSINIGLRHGLCALFMIWLCMFFSGCTRVTAVPESASTLNQWRIARGYQAQGRYELAKQYFTLALAGARSTVSQDELEQEIEVINRMLQTMR
jgi:hypothetical protein